MIPLLLAALAGSPPSVPAPPLSPASGRQLFAWLPGEVRCGAAVAAAMPMRRPLTSLVWGGVANAVPVTYAFTIAADGRTADIRRAGGSAYVPYGDDIEPSLAATRFAAGAPRTGCTLTYAPRQTALAETPVADLVSYSLTPLGGALPPEGWARIAAAGDCAETPRRQPLVRVSPDYRALPATPGARQWSLVGYDLDVAGRPRDVHVVSGTGDAALDAAAARSTADWRFASGTARHGCRQPFWRAPATLALPPMPEEDSARPAGATCPSHHEWSTLPTLSFPEPYRRRAIEGWALVTYDVAPWGEIGNAHVVAAQPSEEFGTQALQVIRRARVPTTQGLTGCVDRVIFRMPPAADAGAEG